MLQQSPGENPGSTTESARPTNPHEEELKHFSLVVLASTEDIWTDIFRQNGEQYRKPTLVLFTDEVQSACGLANSAVGPFYCPGDQKLYLDLGFFDELQTRFRAPGDFAQACVVWLREVGHHVQRLLGTMDKADAARSRLSEAEANHPTVRLELQADFLAGVWAHYAQQKGLLEQGDVEEALNAASAVGDDDYSAKARAM